MKPSKTKLIAVNNDNSTKLIAVNNDNSNT